MNWKGIGNVDQTKLVMTSISEELTEAIDYRTFVKIISNIPSCIFFKDRELRYMFSSHLWREISGTDIVGKTDLEVRKDPENVAAAMESDRNIINTGKGCSYVIKSDIDGVVSYLELIKEPVFDDSGDVIGIVGLINDVTEKTLMRQKLEAANKELQESLDKIEKMNKAQKVFTASVNHELRSPLNGILGLLQILDEDKTLTKIQSSYVHSAYESSKLMIDIVNDLLDAAKIETEGISINKDYFNIKEVVENIKQAVMKMASSKGLNLIINVKTITEAPIYGDETRIKQIIHNLVSNAIKYTEKGEVELQINADDTSITVRVEDTGQGISEEAQKVLFDPFVRINEKANKHIQGTGLGLFIVKKIIDSMHGTIEVNSVVGEGSVFVVQIPVEYGDIQLVQSERTNSIEDFNNISILCVDDTKINTMVFEGLLKDTNANLDIAYSGTEATVKAGERKYDLIFMDHQMPDMDGITTFEIIRANSLLNKDTPVVVMTANVGKDYESEYEKIGFAAYLSKPILKNHLIQCIRQIMD